MPLPTLRQALAEPRRIARGRRGFASPSAQSSSISSSRPVHPGAFPLGSTRITRLRSYYGPVRPRAPRRYSPPPGSSRPVGSLSPPVPHILARDCRISARVLPFHARAADQAHAAFTPDTTWPVNGHPPGSSRRSFESTVSMSSVLISTLTALRPAPLSPRQPDTSWHVFLTPPDASRAPFPQPLTTTVFSQRSAGWLDASPPQGDAEGPAILHLLHSTASARSPTPTLLQRSGHTKRSKSLPAVLAIRL